MSLYVLPLFQLFNYVPNVLLSLAPWQPELTTHVIGDLLLNPIRKKVFQLKKQT